MPSKTTINWLFSDIWCYLFIGCFHWKIGIFQQTVERVYILNLTIREWLLLGSSSLFSLLCCVKEGLEFHWYNFCGCSNALVPWNGKSAGLIVPGECLQELILIKAVLRDSNTMEADSVSETHDNNSRRAILKVVESVQLFFSIKLMYYCYFWINKYQLRMRFSLCSQMHAIHNLENQNHWTSKNNIWELRMLHHE